MNHTLEKNALFHGIGVGSGCASGPLVFFERCHTAKVRAEEGKESESERLALAIKLVKERLKELESRTRQMASDEEAEIFEIHAMLLSDADFEDTMNASLKEGKSAEEAVAHATMTYADSLRALKDPYLSERAKDLEDLREQLLNALGGDFSESVLPVSEEPFILVADDLMPSETVMLDRSKILGFVMQGGSPASHTAILARAMGIPALMGMGAIDKRYNGAYALLDAEEETLLINPDESKRACFKERQKRAEANKKERAERLRAIADRPAVTRGGKKMLVYANVGDRREAEMAAENGADGIGLLRSEILYLSLDRYPSENELTETYCEIVERMRGKRIVIRTLDVGADKQASYFSLPQEENPALGFRGVRVCLAREEVFKTQLRAILRASAHGKIALMFPMIVSSEEVRRSRALLSECMKELDREGVTYDRALEVGVMVETPAAAIMSEELAKEVDFFSVGTNDLTQYTLAADRQNPLVSHICDVNREPVLRLIAHAAKEIHKRGGWIGICGELAADLGLTQRFADMEIDELSVSVPYLLGLRQQIMECK